MEKLVNFDSFFYNYDYNYLVMINNLYYCFLKYLAYCSNRKIYGLLLFMNSFFVYILILYFFCIYFNSIFTNNYQNQNYESYSCI
jgi:hypothetical protein